MDKVNFSQFVLGNFKLLFTLLLLVGTSSILIVIMGHAHFCDTSIREFEMAIFHDFRKMLNRSHLILRDLIKNIAI